jgi:hypothetical protein
LATFNLVFRKAGKAKPKTVYKVKMMKKRTPITVRFFEEEKAAAEQNAQECRLSVSRFLALTGAAGRQPISDEEKRLLIKVVVALNRLGNNVNQLTAASNAGRIGSQAAPADSEIQKAGADVQSLVAAIRARMNI